MTNFVYKPYDTIIIRNMIKLNTDDLLNMVYALDIEDVYWVDGVLFVSFETTISEELAKKEIEGQTYLEKVIFAKQSQYTKTIKSSSNIEINVFNVRNSKLYRDLIAWIKTQPIWNE